MSPRREQTRADVISSSVTSHDGDTILIEAGYSTPILWFINELERGTASPDTERPCKRQKLDDEAVTRLEHEHRLDDVEDIPLFEVCLDICYRETRGDDLRTIVDEVPVVMLDIAVDDENTVISLTRPEIGGPVLKVVLGDMSEQARSLLQRVAYAREQRSAKRKTLTKNNSATVLTCSLRTTSTSGRTIMHLNTALYWRSGFPAHSQGYSYVGSKASRDHHTLLAAFPDVERKAIDDKNGWTPRDFYDNVYATCKDDDSVSSLGRVLESSLYPFQERAVAWMLRREGMRLAAGGLTAMTSAERAAHDFSFVQQCADLNGSTCVVDHLRGIITRERPKDWLCGLSGGLLAEEMGLGKTVEIMALISLHRRPQQREEPSIDTSSEPDTGVRESKATLIITPPAILTQWKAEFERHAPDIRVLHYEGLPTGADYVKKASILLKELAEDYDVVLATYSTLAKEIHYAEDPPDRAMRHARQYARKRSPLVQIRWWRICMDEAQMLESGVTNAARVACRLPRIHSWAVSGTPLRKDVQDLRGLLIFLRFQPFSENAPLWTRMINHHKHLFRKMIHTIALRHTKARVRDELALPPQKRVVINVPFKSVEQQNYSQLHESMCEEIGLHADGSPRQQDWYPQDPRVIEAMRSWLGRLRQTCLHTRLGGKNSGSLGRFVAGKKALQTVEQVLDSMIYQNESSIRLEERALLAATLLRAHILGNNGEDPARMEKALPILESARLTSDGLVGEARERLARATAGENGKIEDLGATDLEKQLDEELAELGSLRHNLRYALEVQHTCTFFAATAYYQIKTNEALTEAQSDRFNQLDAQEAQLYDKAKLIRQEILQDCARKAEASVQKVKEEKNLVKLPELNEFENLGGFESRRLADKANELFDIVNEQAKIICLWREKIIGYLKKPLVDKDDEGQTTGEEYEDSTKQQDELYAYVEVLGALQADLKNIVTGHPENMLSTDVDVRISITRIKTFLNPETPEERKTQVHAPVLALQLFDVRNKLRARMGQAGSLQAIRQEARSLISSLAGNEHSSRATVERQVLSGHAEVLHKVTSSWTNKVLPDLAAEFKQLQNSQNQRLEFYRQLQELSDKVAPYKEILDESLDKRAMALAEIKEAQITKALAQLRTKHRFLTHLRDESNEQVGPKICVICQSTFNKGILTVCGHQYCKECITHWFSQAKTCPVCKRRITRDDYHDIRVGSDEIQAHEETKLLDQNSPSSSKDAASRHTDSSIYTKIDATLMSDIKAIDLPVSYSTKIDALGKHLLYIREHDAGAKALVFSQYREFLDMLATALRHFKVGFVRLGQPGAADKFKTDPSVDCLLLDAKTDSSGLTLVAATHVFICEPLVQTAVELQAIARVHRIGQTRPTTVWMYLVTDTVEEAIYDLSVTRRLQHMQSQIVRSAAPDALDHEHPRNAAEHDETNSHETAIDAANSEELQSAPLTKLLVSGKAGGERVPNEDLWQCLFGKVPEKINELNKK